MNNTVLDKKTIVRVNLGSENDDRQTRVPANEQGKTRWKQERPIKSRIQTMTFRQIRIQRCIIH
jgi:hypothetical protein